jgi:hypothetical protein
MKARNIMNISMFPDDRNTEAVSVNASCAVAAKEMTA